MSEQFDDASGGKSRVEIGLGCPHSSPQKESSVESLSLEDGVLGVYKHFFQCFVHVRMEYMYVCMYVYNCYTFFGKFYAVYRFHQISFNSYSR